MAKMKISSKKAADDPCCLYTPSMYIDLDDLKEVKNLSIGDTVRIVIKGTVKGVEQRESYEDPSKTRASVQLKDFDAEIVPASSQFDDLFDDEGDD